MKTIIFYIGIVMIICFSCNSKDRDPTYISEDIIRFYTGDWECTVINDGIRNTPVTYFFDSANYEMLAPVTEELQIDASKTNLCINILVLRKKGLTVIIDPGLGKDMGSGEGKLLEKLRKLKIDSSEVDYVFLSHGHWDHIGGIAQSDGSLNFPNAKFIMSEKEWNLWTSEEELKKMPEILTQCAKENLTPISERITLVNGDEEILPGIKLIPAPGHTPGQYAILISSGNQHLLYIADAMHYSFQTSNPKASPVADMDPELAAITREELLNMAYDNNYMILGYHFDFPGIGNIVFNKQFGLEFRKLETILSFSLLKINKSPRDCGFYVQTSASNKFFSIIELLVYACRFHYD